MDPLPPGDGFPSAKALSPAIFKMFALKDSCAQTDRQIHAHRHKMITLII